MRKFILGLGAISAFATHCLMVGLLFNVNFQSKTMCFKGKAMMKAFKKFNIIESELKNSV